MRATAAILLFALLSGVHALPARLSRRALREEAPDLILGQAIQEFTLQNTCSEQGVDLRTYFTFNGSFPFFSEDVTSVIPGIFVDYFCDNIGQVNYQFAAPENRLDDPEVQDAIRNGTCLNEQVMLRSLGWQGRGPQSNLTLEWPNGSVYEVYVALNAEDGQQPAVRFSDDGIEDTMYRTADFGEECDEGEDGCMQWHKVSMDSLKPTATFVCAESATGDAKKNSN